MNFFSIRTNDQGSIGDLLSDEINVSFSRLSWHRDEIKIGDIVFIVLSGDKSNKKFSYENGLFGVSIVKSIPKDDPDSGKHFAIDVEVKSRFPRILTKKDFHPYRSLLDAPNIGPETKMRIRI